MKETNEEYFRGREEKIQGMIDFISDGIESLGVNANFIYFGEDLPEEQLKSIVSQGIQKYQSRP